MRDQLIKSKGVVNFKKFFYHAPYGKADGITLIPISEVASKVEFVNIKNTSRDDVLTAHRVPP
jgi:capsid portal protein